MIICTDCIHKEVCGLEDYYDEALITCKYKTELPHDTGHWITQEGYDGDDYYDCSECGESWVTIYGTPIENGMYYCPHCGVKMLGGNKNEQRRRN